MKAILDSNNLLRCWWQTTLILHGKHPITRPLSGPVYIKYGHIRKPTVIKASLCINLELVSDLTFEATLRRFTSRRGWHKFCRCCSRVSRRFLLKSVYPMEIHSSSFWGSLRSCSPQMCCVHLHLKNLLPFLLKLNLV